MTRIKVPTRLASAVGAVVLAAGTMLTIGSGTASADRVCVGGINVGWPGNGTNVDVLCGDGYHNGVRHVDRRHHNTCLYHGCGQQVRQAAAWRWAKDGPDPLWYGAPTRFVPMDRHLAPGDILVRDDFPGRQLEVAANGWETGVYWR